MRIDKVLAERRPVFSFEFFPPKTDEGERNLQRHLDDLRHDQPDFVSVTYGALGTTRDRTIDIVKGIKQDLGHRGDGPLHLRRRDHGELRETLSRDRGGRRRERAGAARRPARGRDRVDARPTAACTTRPS